MNPPSDLPQQKQIAEHPGAFLELLWNLLDSGTRSVESAFHLGVLASQSQEGVDARTVVLRRIHAGLRLLRFHTDKRSPKCRQFADHPQVVWVFYDKDRRLQLRLTGEVSLSDCEVAPPPEKAWQNYSTKLPPGTPLAGADAAWDSGEDPESAVLANFSSYDVKIQTMEFLHLARPSAIRGKFSFQADGNCDFTFLTP